MNMLKAIQSRINQPEKVPAAFKTAPQWAKAWGLSDNHARKLLNIGIDEKLVRRVNFKVRTGVGVRAVPHYGPSKAQAKASGGRKG